MALKFIGENPAPAGDPVVDPKRRNLLTFEWERWFHRLPDFVLRRPSCFLHFTANQSIANATWTNLLWSAEDHDNAAMHDMTSNTDRITIPSDGIYSFGANQMWNADANGDRYIIITLNDAAAAAGSAYLAYDAKAGAGVSNFQWQNLGGRTRGLSADDVLRVQVYQDSGGALDALGSAAFAGPSSCGFFCFKVSK